MLPPSGQIALFTSNDSELQQLFAWARKLALSYAHDGADDPVGPWYEAALPRREAFCMRDVAHQVVGAQILGLTTHNRNMLFRFAENISEARDWCSYWEINRYNKPAPVDYLNDKEFWYNLNANLDVLQACLKMYEWTGDEAYLTDSTFTHFYDHSVTDYVERWQLQPERIMERPPYMNCPPAFDAANHFHTCRGLPSYVENLRGLTLGVDLLATLQAGFRAYAAMALWRGDVKRTLWAEERADAYRRLLDEQWWSEADQHYHTLLTAGGSYSHGEGAPFILWFNATDRMERQRATVKDILDTPRWNVENLSAFPVLFYRLGYPDEALRVLRQLPKENRSTYPEVSFGVIEGMTCGLMGIEPSALAGTVTTCPRFDRTDLMVQLDNVPLLGGCISVRHEGNRSTTLTNRTGCDLTWIASFGGELQEVTCRGKNYPVVHRVEVSGRTVSQAEIPLPAGSTLTAVAR